jgi:hypothetical protein
MRPCVHCGHRACPRRGLQSAGGPFGVCQFCPRCRCRGCGHSLAVLHGAQEGSTCSDCPKCRAIENMEGFATQGSAWNPGGEAYLLIGIEPTGDSSGNGAVVCRRCLKDVALEALALMRSEGEGREIDVGAAIEECGIGEYAYEVEPVFDLDPENPERCAQCGRVIREG